jgi:hypothetical protein
MRNVADLEPEKLFGYLWIQISSTYEKRTPVHFYVTGARKTI